MTQVRPEARPSKTQVARDLASWLELATSSPPWTFQAPALA